MSQKSDNHLSIFKAIVAKDIFKRKNIQKYPLFTYYSVALYKNQGYKIELIPILLGYTPDEK